MSAAVAQTVPATTVINPERVPRPLKVGGGLELVPELVPGAGQTLSFQITGTKLTAASGQSFQWWESGTKLADLHASASSMAIGGHATLKVTNTASENLFELSRSSAIGAGAFTLEIDLLSPGGSPLFSFTVSGNPMFSYLKWKIFKGQQLLYTCRGSRANSPRAPRWAYDYDVFHGAGGKVPRQSVASYFWRRSEAPQTDAEVSAPVATVRSSGMGAFGREVTVSAGVDSALMLCFATLAIRLNDEMANS